jgi:hypothetical protein
VCVNQSREDERITGFHDRHAHRDVIERGHVRDSPIRNVNRSAASAFRRHDVAPPDDQRSIRGSGQFPATSF